MVNFLALMEAVSFFGRKATKKIERTAGNAITDIAQAVC